MPTVQLNIGKTTGTLNVSADLSSLATKPIIMKILSNLMDFDSILTTPIGDVPQFSVPAQIDFSDTGAWNSAGRSQALTLTVDAGVSGALALIAPGAILFQFPANADGSDGRVQMANRNDRDCPFLRISLTVKYSVAGGVTFSFGALGVNGSASAGKTYIVTNYIPCDPSMPFVDAITDAFNAFVLPFNAAGASSMMDGAFLDYAFSGKMAFGARLHYGFSLGAASLGQLKTSFDSPLLKGGLAPAINAGPFLDMKFEADDSFRIIIGRQRSGSKNLVNLCVGKVDKKALGFDLGVALNAGLGAQFDLQDTVDKVLEAAAEKALSRLSDDRKAKALEYLQKGLGADAVTKYISEVQRTINGFLNEVTTTNASFTVAYERNRTNTQLFNYIVDCNVPAALSAGYPAAIRCDFLTAMRTDGVELQPGSFLDDELHRTTTITFQLFNLFEASDVMQLFQNLKTVYAGGGVFRLIYDVGVDWQSVFNGRSEDLKVFFEACSETGDQVTFRNAAITLNFVMTDNADTQRAALTAKVLRLLNNADLTAAAASIQDTVQVTARIHSDAFANLKFDAVKVGNRLNPGSHDNDKRNYEAFVASVEALRPEPQFAQGLRRYEHWVTFNRTANDQSGSTQPPDRADSGNLIIWPDEFASISNSARRFAAIDFEAGRQFMNLCEFLDSLNDETLDDPMTKQLFNKLLDSLNSAIENSSTVLTWYSKACFSALASLLAANIVNISGPAKPGDPINISFELEPQTSVAAKAKT
jgi:hypothetical protein